MAARLAWVGPFVAILCIGAALLLGRFEYYETTVHLVLAAVAIGAGVVGLVAGVVAAISGARARKR